MALLDTSILGSLISGMSTWTGGIFLSMLIILMLFVGAMLAFRMPLFLIIIITLPFIIAATFITSAFWTVVGLICFYLAFLLARLMLN